MFKDATSFNQPLNLWDTSNVQYMNSMFSGATSFNQNIGNWNIGSLTEATDMFAGDTLSTYNYNKLLNGWAEQDVNDGVYFTIHHHLGKRPNATAMQEPHSQ